MFEPIHEYIISLYNFWDTITIEKFVRLFWFFFIFDFLRYVGFDLVIVCVLDPFKRWLERDRYQNARERLFKENPLISVIAPGKNEGAHIPELARSFKRQTYKNLEIIVVDDGSDDNTPEICNKALREGLIDQFFRNDVRGGKASAANLALRYAKGKYIVHLDADSHIYDDGVEKLVIPFFMDDTIGAIGGDVRVNNTSKSLVTALQGIEYAKAISTGRRITSYLGILRIISGAYGAFRKDALDRIGGWDVGPGLDGDNHTEIQKTWLSSRL